MSKRTKFIALGGLALVLIVLVSFKKHTAPPEYETAKAERLTLVQEVKATGKVKPAQQLDLAFESSGKVAEVKVSVGQNVKQGDVLILQNGAEASARVRRASASVASSQSDVAQALASLESEKAKLESLKSGTRSEEIQIAQATVEQAARALEDARITLLNTQTKANSDLGNTYDDVPETVETVYTMGTTAFLEDISDLFEKGTQYDTLNFLTKDSEKKNQIQRQKIDLKYAMDSWRNDISLVGTDVTSRESLIQKSKYYLGLIRNFLGNVSLAVDDNATLSETTEDAYRSSVNTAKSTVNSAMAELVAQEQDVATQKNTNTAAIQSATAAVNSAQKALEVANNELRLKQAGPRKEEITDGEARVKQSEANVSSARARVSQSVADLQSAQAEYQKTILTSPMDGVITVVNAKVGEFIGPTTIAVSVISQADYEVEVSIPEVDIAKMSVGKNASVTLDAYGETVSFPVTVSKIDPAETIVDGIATYKVTLQFEQKDERIKSGMTANTVILIEKRENVVALPLRGVVGREGKQFVKVLSNPKATPQEVVVQTGLKGNNGMVEILSGVSEGQTIVLSQKIK